jgi:hypothetical protein
MSSHGRTKLVPPKTEPEKQVLESSLLEQKEEPVLPELDMEIECPRCNDIMELNSRCNDTLAYSCESCSFLLKCV